MKRHKICNRLRLLSYLAITSASLLLGVSVQAQLVPDNTLGVENSLIVPQVGLDLIEGGARRGSGLFHSFQEFNVNQGQQVIFANPNGVENILTRVTGNNASNLFGTLGVGGTANLFLINPNGIIFGPDAQLNLGGSFFASTANGIKLADGSFFSTINPQAPPLLTINVPLGLQLGANPEKIEVQGTGNLEIFPLNNPGLAVTPGNTLALVGGDVTFTGGVVTVPSGRIEIGSVANGEVDLIPTPGGWLLGYERVTDFANIRLQQNSSLFNPAVADNPLSDIQVVGGNIALDGSQIAAVTPGEFNSGDITIRATESLEIAGISANLPLSSWIVNLVAPGAQGNSGAITVATPNLTVTDGARIQTMSRGAGAAGKVTVNADNLEVSGFAPLPGNLPDLGFGNPAKELLELSLNSRISSENFASGPGGEVEVSSRQINFSDGGQIGSLTGSVATAKGGNVTVNTDSITGVRGYPVNPLVASGIVSFALGEGEGGDIAVSAKEVNLSEGSQIYSWNPGSQQGGDVTVKASESIIGRGVNPNFPIVPSGIYASAVGGGDGGQVNVSTQQLTLSQGAGISSLVISQVFPGIEPVPNAGEGDGGDVMVEADRIELIGTTPLAPENFTQLGSITFGKGDAGDVSVSTRQLIVSDGAALTSSVIPSLFSIGEPPPGAGEGDGGNLEINASESVEIRGVNPFIISPSFVGVQTFAFGDAGELVVNTNRLILEDGGSMSTFTSATGNADQITVNASEILVSGRGANGFSSTLGANAFLPDESLQQAFFLPPFPTGNTGVVALNAEQITVRDGGAINVQHAGTGNAGQLQVNATRVLLDQGSILANTAFGNGGNLNLNIDDILLLRNNSLISTTAGTAFQPGDGGNMDIRAGFVVAVPQENSDIIANAFQGNGGRIEISTNEIIGLEFRNRLTPKSDITAFTSSPEEFRQGEFRLIRFEPGVLDKISDLPEPNLVDPSNQIIAGCSSTQGNRFVVTGRGGIPDDPRQYLRGRSVWRDMRNLSAREGSGQPITINQQPTSNQTQLVEAQGWIIEEDGTVILTAESSSGKLASLPLASLSCHNR